jgi:hypothetical protein
MEAEVDERVVMRAGDEIDRAAWPPVTTIRTAAGDELLAPEADAAPAALPSSDQDVNFVDKHVEEATRARPLTARNLVSGRRNVEAQGADARMLGGGFGGLDDGMDADEATARAVILELDHALDLREQRVVLAEADVQARAELAAALADENRAAGDEVAVELLAAKPL